jgi:hypothetical protein
MSAQGTGELDADVLPRLARWALVLWAALLAVTLPFDRRAAAAIALGGAISLGSFQCYRMLVPAWVRRDRPRLARIGLPALSLVKWPVLWVVLSWAVRTQGLSVEWLCVGLGLIPAAVTALAISTVAADARRQRRLAGAGR